MFNTDDLGKVRDLSSANQNLTANLVAARALGNQWAATLNATFTTSASQQMQGLPSLSLTVPGGGPLSPFSQDVKLYRYFAGQGPLDQDTANWSGHLGLTVNKQAGRWRFSLTGAYDHSDTLIETGAGFNPAPMQALLNAGSASFNPFGPIPANLVSPLPDSEARSISDSGNLQVLVNGPLAKVPAGNLNMAFKFGDSESGFQSGSQRWDLIHGMNVTQAVGLSRNDLNGQLNLDLPLASKRYNFLPWFGELAVNANVNFDRLSDFGTLHSLGYGLNWTPIPQVRVIVSHTRDEAAPSVSQLGSPTVITPNVRVFDYVTGQTVDVTQTTGANPFLIGDARNVFKAGVTIRPWTEKQFSINANYVDQRVDNPISTFPSATAQIQAAFPDHFLRDANGDLIQVDQRPVNFDWTARRNIRFGFNWSTPVGKAPPRPQRPAGPFPFPRRDGQAPGQGQGPQSPHRPAAGQAQGPAAGAERSGPAGQAARTARDKTLLARAVRARAAAATLVAVRAAAVPAVPAALEARAVSAGSVAAAAAVGAASAAAAGRPARAGSSSPCSTPSTSSTRPCSGQESPCSTCSRARLPARPGASRSTPSTGRWASPRAASARASTPPGPKAPRSWAAGSGRQPCSASPT